MDKQDDQSQNSSLSSSSGWYKATILRRYFALLIDSLIMIPISLLIVFFGREFLGETLTNLSYYIVAALYGTFFIWKFGATLGKKLLGLKVVNTQYQQISFGKALLRETIGKFLSGLVFSLGYLWALWDKDKQAWHDKIAGSYVVTKRPNSGKESAWMFILISLFLVISIIGILAAVIVLIINPVELTKRARDAARLSDLSYINQAMTDASDTKLFCGREEIPCGDQSNINTSSSLDGKGWIKADLSQIKIFPDGKLPIDPVNSNQWFYRYCSNGIDWEVNAILESKEYESKAASDDGDNNTLYEIGSNLMLCK